MFGSRVQFQAAPRIQGAPVHKQQRIPLGVIPNGGYGPSRLDGDCEAADPSSRFIPHDRHNLFTFRHLQRTIGNTDDPQDITEYEHIIYRSMRTQELRTPVMQIEQPEVTPRDRALLVDWMCRLHYKVQITTEAFYRAVGILDRAFCSSRISRHKLKLLGSAAMLMASKIEDVRPMQVVDAVAIAEAEFSSEDLKKMEMQLINLIDFDTEFPTPLFFLTIFLNVHKKTEETMLLARYILE
jgi:hypothetical protein